MNTCKIILALLLCATLIAVCMAQGGAQPHLDRTKRSLFSVSSISQVQATTTVLSATPTTPTSKANCFPFFVGTQVIIAQPDTWLPYFFGIYKNLPAAEIQAGDKIVFDMTSVNEVVQSFDIALAHTQSNGGVSPDVNGFTVIAPSTSPPVPGDFILDNYELSFVVTTPFSFAGGGLMIRFSVATPSAFASDNVCEFGFNGASASDPSNLFVRRVYAGNDFGKPPGVQINPEDFIPAFKIIRSTVGTCTQRTCPSGKSCCRFVPPCRTTPIEKCFGPSKSCIPDMFNPTQACLCKTGDECCNQVCYDPDRFRCTSSGKVVRL